MRGNVLLAAVIALSLGAAGGATPQERPQPWQTLRATAPLPLPAETGRLVVGDVALHYAVYGRGEPVILLHPALGNGEYWANQIGPLSQEFQVIVLDLRGHGRSSASDRPLTYRLMADDVLRFIKIKKLKRPAIVGWGDGATVGLELALRYPKRVGKLVAFGLVFDRSGLQPRPDTSATFIDYVHKAQADHVRLSGSPTGFAQTLDQMETLWEHEPAYTAADLQGVKVPTTLIAAEYDEWVKPEHIQQAARLIPGARIMVLSRASHFAPWQATKIFDDSLLLTLRH